MKVKILSCDNTGGSNEEKENPSWEEVESSILSMDGETRSMVGLMLDNSDHHLMIGGGNSNFILNINTGDTVYFLIDPEKSEEEYVSLMAGQPSEYPENQIANLDTVLSVTKYYFEEGKPDNSQNWLIF